MPASSIAHRCTSLNHLLADSYTLYLKTHNYHWNVTGPMFTTLHTLFMTQYSELALAVDEVAERIRTLGERAPGSYSEFAKLASVAEDTGSPKATTMIETLVADQEKVVAVRARRDRGGRGRRRPGLGRPRRAPYRRTPEERVDAAQPPRVGLASRSHRGSRDPGPDRRIVPVISRIPEIPGTYLREYRR